MILNDGSDWQPTPEQLDKWEKAYKDTCVDIHQELVMMDLWCDANPAKRKTRKGVASFCTKWFKRTLEQGGKSIELQKEKEQEFKQRLEKRKTSLRNKGIEEQMCDISWLSGSQYELMKQYYLDKHGRYFDGEFKYG